MSVNQINEMKDTLRHSLARRKEISQQTNETTYQEEVIEELSNGNMSNEPDVSLAYLLEKNHSLIEQVKLLKKEQELQSRRMFEVMEQKRKVEDDKKMMEKIRDKSLQDWLLKMNKCQG